MIIKVKKIIRKIIIYNTNIDQKRYGHSGATDLPTPTSFFSRKSSRQRPGESAIAFQLAAFSPASQQPLRVFLKVLLQQLAEAILTLGEFLDPLTMCHIPEPIAPIANAAPVSFKITQGLIVGKLYCKQILQQAAK